MERAKRGGCRVGPVDTFEAFYWWPRQSHKAGRVVGRPHAGQLLPRVTGEAVVAWAGPGLSQDGASVIAAVFMLEQQSGARCTG